MLATPSPRWIKQVLRDRGIAGADLAQIEAYVGGLNNSERRHLFEVIKRIELGVEQPGHIDTLLQDINSVQLKQAPTTSEKAAASSSVVKTGGRSSKPDARHPSKDPAPWYRGEGFHAYASGCSMKAELDELQGDEQVAKRYTVLLEIAPALPGSDARGYDWERKIAFQITRRELPVLASFLLGYRQADLRFTNHGPDRNKTLDMRHQPQGIFIRLTHAKQANAMPIEAHDVYELGVLTLKALQMNSGGLESPAILEMLRKVGSLGKTDNA